MWVWNLVSYIKRRTDWGFVRAGGEGNIWCEREGGIEGCRRLCSELHVCYCSPDIITRKIICLSLTPPPSPTTLFMFFFWRLKDFSAMQRPPCIHYKTAVLLLQARSWRASVGFTFQCEAFGSFTSHKRKPRSFPERRECLNYIKFQFCTWRQHSITPSFPLLVTCCCEALLILFTRSVTL